MVFTRKTDSALVAALMTHKLDFCSCNNARLDSGLLHRELAVGFKELHLRTSLANARENLGHLTSTVSLQRRGCNSG